MSSRGNTSGKVMTAQHATVTGLISMLDMNRPIIDKTALKGTFDFNMQWTPDENDPSGLSIFTAIQRTTRPATGFAKRPRRGPGDRPRRTNSHRQLTRRTATVRRGTATAHPCDSSREGKLDSMNWSAIAAIMLGLAVAIGAFGAHGLKGRLDDYSMGVYEKAVIYHFFHALGLLIVSILPRIGAITQSVGTWVCALLFAGILLFSGSLYALALTGVKALGAVTPLGGLAFLAAWFLLAFWLFRNNPTAG
jgi:uncharacterized membrane protein YgdD (TMEM256/DUF423 family)